MPAGEVNERATALAALCRERLRAGPYRVRLESASMAPAFRPGDELSFEPLPPGGARFGDVVLSFAPARAITHRVVGRRGGYYRLKGDASPRFDAPASKELVVGRLAAVTRAGGRAAPWRGFRRRLADAALACLSLADGGLAAAGATPARKLLYLLMKAAAAFAAA